MNRDGILSLLNMIEGLMDANNLLELVPFQNGDDLTFRKAFCLIREEVNKHVESMDELRAEARYEVVEKIKCVLNQECKKYPDCAHLKVRCIDCKKEKRK